MPSRRDPKKPFELPIVKKKDGNTEEKQEIAFASLLREIVAHILKDFTYIQLYVLRRTSKLFLDAINIIFDKKVRSHFANILLETGAYIVRLSAANAKTPTMYNIGVKDIRKAFTNARFIQLYPTYQAAAAKRINEKNDYNDSHEETATFLVEGFPTAGESLTMNFQPTRVEFRGACYTFWRPASDKKFDEIWDKNISNICDAGVNATRTLFQDYVGSISLMRNHHNKAETIINFIDTQIKTEDNYPKLLEHLTQTFTDIQSEPDKYNKKGDFYRRLQYAIAQLTFMKQQKFEEEVAAAPAPTTPSLP